MKPSQWGQFSPSFLAGSRGLEKVRLHRPKHSLDIARGPVAEARGIAGTTKDSETWAVMHPDPDAIPF